MKIAGLDIGTTGCKLTVFDPDGKNLGHSYRDYPVKRGKSEHEVDAEAIMGSVMEVIRDMAGKYPDIAGIGVTSFGETFVMADSAPQGDALYRPAGKGRVQRTVGEDGRKVDRIHHRSEAS